MHGLDVRGEHVLVLGVVTLEMSQFGRSLDPDPLDLDRSGWVGRHVESFRSRTAAEAALARADVTR